MKKIIIGIQPTRTKPFHLGVDFNIIAKPIIGCSDEVLFNMVSGMLKELTTEMLNDDNYQCESKVIIMIFDDRDNCLIAVWESFEK